MRTVIRRRLAVVAGAMAGLALASLLLTGCVSAPAPRPTSTPHATPLFATDDAALAAATKAYAAYLAMSDTIAHDGGTDPERIKEVATGQALSDELTSSAQYREAGARSVGAMKFLNAKIQSVSPKGVAFYVCDDVSGIDVIGPTGASLVSATRPAQTPFVVTVERTGDGGLVVSSHLVWKGENFCE